MSTIPTVTNIGQAPGRYKSSLLPSRFLPGRLRWLTYGLCLLLAADFLSDRASANTGLQAVGSLQTPQRIDVPSSRVITLVYSHPDHKKAMQIAGNVRLFIHRNRGSRAFSTPTGMGVDQKVAGFDERNSPVIETRLHLLFDAPMAPGRTYWLDIPGKQEKGRMLPVLFDPNRVTSSLQVDQLGYATRKRKFAYAGNWLGTLGPLPIDAEKFYLIDHSGKVVFEGRLTLRAAGDVWSGNDVYEADFSEVTSPGIYRIKVPSLGSSYPFEIAPDIYQRAYRTCMRLFYHSRNSIPIVAPYADAGYERPQGGVPEKLNGVLHPSVFAVRPGTGDARNGFHPVSRGWFDAGDYGQYIPNAAIVWYAISAAMDLAPDRFQDGELHIPESGNGIPDVLDELKWGMDWALSMQDVDGGVYWRISSETWDEGLPHQIQKPRYIYEKTTHATASFAAMCAIYARLILPYDAVQTNKVLKAGEKAWTFLQTHAPWPTEGDVYRNPSGTHAGEYQDSSFRDNMLWAAAELYRTTGKVEYRQAYELAAPGMEIDPTRVPSYKHVGMAALWAYMMAEKSDRNAALVQQAEKLIIAAADWRIRMGKAHPFRAMMYPGIKFVGWGSFAHSTRTTLLLLQAYYLTGEERYLRWAWLSPHPQLGANPLSQSFITGLGDHPPRHPLSKLSRYGGAPEPLRGIPVNGPQFHLPESIPAHKIVNRSYFPPESVKVKGEIYPVLRRYVDSNLLPPMSEPTVAEYAYTAMAYVLLRDERLPLRVRRK